MIFLVNDANILIDLLKIDLLDFFSLNYDFHVTDLVFDSEIQEEKDYRLEMLVASHLLKKHGFSFEELIQIEQLREEHAGLSIPDCSCLYLSQKLDATLLTGDAALRRIAEQKGIDVHGILWIFDEMIANNKLTKHEAAEKLEKLMGLNQRLPCKECQKRLKAWRRTI